MRGDADPAGRVENEEPAGRVSEAPTVMLSDQEQGEEDSAASGEASLSRLPSGEACLSRLPSVALEEEEEEAGGWMSERAASQEACVSRLHAVALEEGWLMEREEVDFSQARMVGIGSVGQVFRARLCLTNEQIAVKAVRDDLTMEQRIQNRSVEDLVQEVKMLSSIGTHPRIVRFIGCILDISDPTASPTIIEEFLGGGSIQDVFDSQSLGKKTRWRPPRHHSLLWCQQLCEALVFLHGRETPLVHRDLKPSNLFISSDWKQVKLGDFGLCRTVRHAEDDRTMTGMTGSYTHMAPEVFLREQGYTQHADLFSAAVCMVGLITGEAAYAKDAERYGAHPEILAKRVATEGYRCSLTPLKSPGMAVLIADMWQHEPAQRPSAFAALQSIKEVTEQRHRWRWGFLGTLKRAVGIANSQRSDSRNVCENSENQFLQSLSMQSAPPSLGPTPTSPLAGLRASGRRLSLRLFPGPLPTETSVPSRYKRPASAQDSQRSTGMLRSSTGGLRNGSNAFNGANALNGSNGLADTGGVFAGRSLFSGSGVPLLASAPPP